MNKQQIYRKALIAKIALTLKNEKVDKEKLIALLGIEQGIARRTALELIRCAEVANTL